jgi:4-amino-4-deoxy-L-arabinose transferase-like glycosyltransferase
MKKRHIIFCLLAAVLIAAAFRFVGFKWDENRHLHPDERFLTTVTNDIKWTSPLKYFDYKNSTLNPHIKVPFFIYGTFPVFLTKAVGDITGYSNYDKYYLIGRFFSTLFDLLTIIVIFFIGKELFDVKTGLVASFLLAITVIHIQHSHFYVVDLFAAFFLTLCMYLLMLWIKNGKFITILLAGISLGFAASSKISAILFLPIIALACSIFFIKELVSGLNAKREPDKVIMSSILRVALSILLVLVFGFLIFRIFQPYAFTGPNIWNLQISDGFASSYKTQQGFNDPNSRYPPTYQWRHRSPFFQVNNLTLWGLGIPLSIICWLGVLLGVYQLIFRKKWIFLLPLAWITFLIAFHATQFMKNTRYLLPITPFLVLFGAYFLTETYKFLIDSSLFKPKIKKQASLGVILAIIIFSMLWPLAFTNIYLHQHPRIVASNWIFENLPINATVANEHWDDNLPFYSPPGRLRMETLSIYDSDNDAKIDKLSEQLSRTDYIFITSNRVYGSVMRLPELWNSTITYYTVLFNGELGYTLEKEFENYPSFAGLEINDDNAEESFTVYDHTKVLIYKNEKRLGKEEIKSLLVPTRGR